MHVTRVGLGAWAMGGGAWAYSLGPQDDRDSVATIRHAVVAGVNWIDTAAAYGLGHSERVIARALRDIPEAERPYVFTKAGLVWDESDRSLEPRKIGTPTSIRGEVDASLRRLQTDRIDLYQMHWPPTDGTPLEDYWQTLLDLKTEGKVRAVGLSNHDVAQLEAAEALGHVDSLQPVFNAIHRDAAADVVPWCTEHGTGVIVYSPMASGLLSGAYTAERAASLDEGDRWRTVHPDFTGEAVPRNLAVADLLRTVAGRHTMSVAAVAVAWTLAFPITGAIVGARTPEQLDGWLTAATTSLEPADLDEIAAGIRHIGAGSGPEHPKHDDR
ncbi:MAG: aldo/keto reductase [Nitriliruptorales bacterium]|nr:aldo/keto reductase [Nitriliruptorales bacterium]